MKKLGKHKEACCAIILALLGLFMNCCNSAQPKGKQVLNSNLEVIRKTRTHSRKLRQKNKMVLSTKGHSSKPTLTLKQLKESNGEVQSAKTTSFKKRKSPILKFPCISLSTQEQPTKPKKSTQLPVKTNLSNQVNSKPNVQLEKPKQEPQVITNTNSKELIQHPVISQCAEKLDHLLRLRKLSENKQRENRKEELTPKKLADNKMYRSIIQKLEKHSKNFQKNKHDEDVILDTFIAGREAGIFGLTEKAYMPEFYNHSKRTYVNPQTNKRVTIATEIDHFNKVVKEEAYENEDEEDTGSVIIHEPYNGPLKIQKA